MEILYIHIKEFRNFIHQDFNFGGKFRFEYNRNSHELTVYENHLYIESFYNEIDKNTTGAYISNLSGIIGENGTGKSSLLRFILRNFVNGNSGLEDDLIVCLRNKENYILYHTYDLPIKKHNLDKFGISLKLIKVNDDLWDLHADEEEIHKKGLNTKIKLFEDLDFIFFSNSLNHLDYVQLNGSRDISIDYLIKNDYNFKAEMSIIDPVIDKRQLDHFKYAEIKRQVAFITEMTSHKNLIPFALPEVLILEVSNEMLFDKFQLENRLRSTLERNTQLSSFYKIHKFLSQFDNSNAINRIIGNGYLNLIIDLLLIPIDLFPLNKLIKTIVIRIKATSDILKTIQKTILYMNSFNEFESLDGYIERFESLLKLHHFLEKTLLQNHIDSVLSQFPRRISIPISDIENFYSIYNKTFQLRPYLNLDWRSLSSGEKAIFSIYSRFYSLSNSQATGNELKKNIAILIDEPDLYLHPQWQKVLFHNLIGFFKHIFAETPKRELREIQIIYTTNAPLMISDLLASNAVFLKKENDNVIVKDSLSDQKQSFAANIHTLYADSFFIQDGLIGKIASVKINAIIKQLNRLEPLDHIQHEKMRKTILQIGEPVIKTKLIQMYNDRFSMNIHERIENLEKRLDKND